MGYDRKSLLRARRSLGAGFISAKAALWRLLQRGGAERRIFWRRHSVGPYVLELCCPDENLVIDVIGAGQGGTGTLGHDAARMGFLEAIGLRILRIEKREVFRNPEGVVALIRRHFKHPR